VNFKKSKGKSKSTRNSLRS